jgi:hypothetical protein
MRIEEECLAEVLTSKVLVSNPIESTYDLYDLYGLYGSEEMRTSPKFPQYFFSDFFSKKMVLFFKKICN